MQAEGSDHRDARGKSHCNVQELLSLHLEPIPDLLHDNECTSSVSSEVSARAGLIRRCKELSERMALNGIAAVEEEWEGRSTHSRDSVFSAASYADTSCAPAPWKDMTQTLSMEVVGRIISESASNEEAGSDPFAVPVEADPHHIPMPPSSLEPHEHVTYTDLVRKARIDEQGNVSSVSDRILTRSSHQLLRRLEERVRKEQAQWRQFAHAVATSHIEWYSTYEPEVAAVVEVDIERRRRHGIHALESLARDSANDWSGNSKEKWALSAYSRCVSTDAPVSIHTAASDRAPELIEEILLKEMGHRPYWAPLRSGSNVVCPEPRETGESSTCAAEFLEKKPLGLDEELLAMIAVHDVDIVTTASALAALGAWCYADPTKLVLPCRVVTTRTRRKTVTFIEKPLLPEVMTLRRKNEIYAKYGLLSRCSVRTPSGGSERWTPPFLRPNEQAIGTAVSNLSYRIWGLGHLRVLVRCTDDAECNNTPVCVRSKMEYLPAMGIEEVPLFERARWWISCALRPGSKLALGRVDVHRRQVMQDVQLMDLPAIENGDPLFSKEKLQQWLLSAMKIISGVDRKQFLLVREAFQPCAHIIRPASGEGDAGVPQINVVEQLLQSGKTDVSVIPYLTPCPMSDSARVPLTFPPRESTIPPQKRRHGSRNKRKSKRRRKHQNGGGDLEHVSKLLAE